MTVDEDCERPLGGYFVVAVSSCLADNNHGCLPQAFDPDDLVTKFEKKADDRRRTSLECWLFVDHHGSTGHACIDLLNSLTSLT